MATKPDATVTLEQFALGKGVREWLDSIGPTRARAVAFDTRVKAPRWLTGSAAAGITRGLRRHGAQVVSRPVSFFVTKHNSLRHGELERAKEWGNEFAAAVVLRKRPRASV